jgi:hypothetical protein
MALRGTLRDFSLGEILQLIGFQRKTGILTIEAEADTVSISFLEGRVVDADSLRSNFENRLGNLLVRAGKIDRAVLEMTLEDQRRTRQRLGSLLVERQLISNDDLRLALRTQILNLIYRLFRWEDGRYHFSQSSTMSYDAANFTPVETENILMQAARMSDEWPQVESRVPSFEIVFRRAPGAEDLRLVSEPDPSRPDALLVSESEARIWDLVDGRKTVGELVESIFQSDFETVKALSELARRELVLPVEPSEPEAEEAPRASETAAEQPSTGGASWPVWAALAVLLGVSLAMVRKNPINVLFRWDEPSWPGGGVRRSVEVARLQRIDRGIEVFYLTEGSYPDSLSDLSVASILTGYDLPVGRFGVYRYILRVNDGKYDLYGKTRRGVLDPNLSLTRRLDPVSDEVLDRLRHKRRKDLESGRSPAIDLVH